MKNHSIISALLLCLLLTVGFSACSDNDDTKGDAFTYSVSLDTSAVTGSTSYTTQLAKLDTKDYTLFELTGSQTDCDTKAKAQFAAFIQLVQRVIDSTTGTSGYISYKLYRDGVALETLKVTFPQ